MDNINLIKGIAMPTITIHLPYGGKKGDKSKSKRDYMGKGKKTTKRKGSSKNKKKR